MQSESQVCILMPILVSSSSGTMHSGEGTNDDSRFFADLTFIFLNDPGRSSWLIDSLAVD